MTSAGLGEAVAIGAYGKSRPPPISEFPLGAVPNVGRNVISTTSRILQLEILKES